MALHPVPLHEKLFKELTPAMRIKPGEDFAAWQKAAREKLAAMVGWPLLTAEPNFRIEWEKPYDDNSTEIRFLFQSEPETDVLCHLIVPNGQKKVPLILCLQGHSTGMHISLGRPKFEGDEKSISGGDRDFARQIAARGQAALVIEQRCFGERGGKPNPDCYQPSMQAILLGRTMIGERCWDVSRAIDAVLAHFDRIDPERIAIMGNSGGGTTSIYAAALDERIAACMPSCAFCGYWASIGAQYHCSCNYIPGIAQQFDMGDLGGLIAPRPLVVVNGQEDNIFPIDSAKEQFEITRGLYAAAGAEAKLRHVVGPEGHRFYAAIGWKAFDELTGWRE